MARYIKDNFYWWMSEDDVLGWPDKYLYSDWLDVNWNSNYIQLANAPVEAIDTWSEIADYLMTVSSSTFWTQPNVLAFTDSWIFRDDTVWAIEWNVWKEANFVIWDTMYFVKNNWNTAVFTLYSEPVDSMLTSWSPVLTVVTTAWRLGLNYLWVYNAWTAYVINDAVSYWGQDYKCIQAWTWKTPDVYPNYWDLIPVGAMATNNTYFNNWVTVLWDIAYIWLGDKITRFQPTAWNEVATYDIFWDEIIFVSYVWGYFRVYTKTWKLMLWDWNTVGITESIDLKLPLEAWYQIWNIDYLYSWLTWGQTGLYYMSGYDLVPLFKQNTSNQIWEQKFYFSTSNNKTPMANYWATLFGHTDNSWNERVFGFGKHIEWLPNAYFELPKYSSYGLEYIATRSLTVMWSYLFYAFNDWTNKWVDKVLISNSDTIKTKEWTLITNVNPLWAWLYKKTSKYIYFKVWNVDADRTIEVQISYDWWAYTSLGTITEQPLDNIVRLPVQWDFRDYSIKFILATTLSTITSPKIYYWYAFDYEQHDI